VGTNHPVAVVQLVAVVTASLRSYQLLLTSLDAGATIQMIPPPDLQITFPPPSSAGSPNENLFANCQNVGPTMTGISIS